MGINELILSPELIAALYPDSLVDSISGENIQKAVNPEKPGAVTKYPFLGLNLRSVVFLVNYPDHRFMPDEKLAFLTRMLSACKYSLEDIAIINTAKLGIQLDTLRAQFEPQFIFLWDVPAALLGMTQTKIPDLSVSILDSISVVHIHQADLLSSEAEGGLELKKKLWTLLKKLFNL